MSVDKSAKEFTSAILSAAHKSIPRDRRKDYKPWNKELDDLHNQLCDALEQMEKQPSIDNIANHNKLKDTFEQRKVNQIQESWRDKTSSLNLEKDTTKLWQLTNLLNDDNRQQKKTTRRVDNQCIIGKKAANEFAKTYEKVSTIKQSQERIKLVRQEIRSFQPDEPQQRMTESLTMQELK